MLKTDDFWVLLLAVTLFYVITTTTALKCDETTWTAKLQSDGSITRGYNPERSESLVTVRLFKQIMHYILILYFQRDYCTNCQSAKRQSLTEISITYTCEISLYPDLPCPPKGTLYHDVTENEYTSKPGQVSVGCCKDEEIIVTYSLKNLIPSQ